MNIGFDPAGAAIDCLKDVAANKAAEVCRVADLQGVLNNLCVIA